MPIQFSRAVRFGIIAVLWALAMWQPTAVTGPMTGELLGHPAVVAVLYLYTVLLVTAFGRRVVQLWLVLGAAVSMIAMDGLTLGHVILFVAAVLAAARFVTDLFWQVQRYEAAHRSGPGK